MSLAACEMRWPWTTRSPWLANALAPRCRLEHRRPRLLGLQDEGVAAVAADEQDDPRARPHAADAHDLPRQVDEAVRPEQEVPVGGQAGRVLVEQPLDEGRLVVRAGRVEELADGRQQRRDAAEAQLAADALRELPDGPQARL